VYYPTVQPLLISALSIVHRTDDIFLITDFVSTSPLQKYFVKRRVCMVVGRLSYREQTYILCPVAMIVAHIFMKFIYGI